PANGLVSNQNFGNTLGSIAGIVDVDYNLSGAYDPAGPNNPDRPIPNITVTLLDGNGNVVSVHQTAADGSYFFGGLGLGDYTVTETQHPLPDSRGDTYD